MIKRKRRRFNRITPFPHDESHAPDVIIIITFIVVWYIAYVIATW